MVVELGLLLLKLQFFSNVLHQLHCMIHYSDETFLGDSDSEDIEDSSEYNDFEDFEKSYYSNYSNGNELEIQVSKTNIISLFNSKRKCSVIIHLLVLLILI